MNTHWDDLQDEAIRLYHRWLNSEEPVIDLTEREPDYWLVVQEALS